MQGRSQGCLEAMFSTRKIINLETGSDIRQPEFVTVRTLQKPEARHFSNLLIPRPSDYALCTLVTCREVAAALRMDEEGYSHNYVLH